MTILRNGSFSTNPLEELHNTHFYSGDENYIIMTRTYTQRFICKYMLHNYPFDVQLCTMDFILGVRFFFTSVDCSTIHWWYPRE